jgi:polysaccharide pyruvyl transferase WcaK-like protein
VPQSVDEAVTVLRSSRGVIAMRLHALILAASFVNTVCVSRTTKSKALMSDLNMRGVDLSEIHDGNAEVVANDLAIMVGSPASLVNSTLICERRKRLVDYYEKSADYIKGRLSVQ